MFHAHKPRALCVSDLDTIGPLQISRGSPDGLHRAQLPRDPGRRHGAGSSCGSSRPGRAQGAQPSRSGRERTGAGHGPGRSSRALLGALTVPGAPLVDLRGSPAVLQLRSSLRDPGRRRGALRATLPPGEKSFQRPMRYAPRPLERGKIPLSRTAGAGPLTGRRKPAREYKYIPAAKRAPAASWTP